MKLMAKSFLAGVVLVATSSVFAQTADKIVIAHRGPAAICQNTRCRRRRWPMPRARITLSKTW